MSNEQQILQVAIQMRKQRITGSLSQWQPWRWVLEAVVMNEAAFGDAPRLLMRDDDGERWLHPGFEVQLFRDEAEGYYLNVHSPAPCWFVMWRMEEEASITDDLIARPQQVTLSYHEAARWLDAQETVEQVPAPAEVVEWMRAYVEANYKPEPKKRKRPESFKSLDARFGDKGQ